MKTFSIIRVSFTSDGVFGVIREGKKPFALTCEPEWHDNKQNISCVPSGTYKCKRVNSPKYGNTFEIIAEGREHVLFHWGKKEEDTKGCILIAEKFGELNNKTAILQSKNVPGEGFNEFLKRTENMESFLLEVIDGTNN